MKRNLRDTDEGGEMLEKLKKWNLKMLFTGQPKVGRKQHKTLGWLSGTGKLLGVEKQMEDNLTDKTFEGNYKNLIPY
jgi:hypothetical protein